jgi:hypothetical protein
MFKLPHDLSLEPLPERDGKQAGLRNAGRKGARGGKLADPAAFINDLSPSAELCFSYLSGGLPPSGMGF